MDKMHEIDKNIINKLLFFDPKLRPRWNERDRLSSFPGKSCGVVRTCPVFATNPDK